MDGGRDLLQRAGSAARRARSRRSSGRLVRSDRTGTALGLALGGAVLVGLIAGWVAGSDEDTGLDSILERIIDAVLPMGHGAAKALGEFIADLGSPVSTALLMLAAAVFAYLRCGPRALALVLTGPPIAMVLSSTILKPLIGRTRGETLAFPSGHTTSITSIALAVAIIVLSTTLSQKRRRWALGILAALPVAVALCLVGREYHYPTDTLGAVGVAVATVLLSAVVVDAMADSMALDPHDVAGPPVQRADEPGAAVAAAPTERLAPPGRPQA